MDGGIGQLFEDFYDVLINKIMGPFGEVLSSDFMNGSSRQDLSDEFGQRIWATNLKSVQVLLIHLTLNP